MRDRQVAAIWIGGLMVAAVAFTVGTDRFMELVLGSLGGVLDALDDVARNMASSGAEAFKALAIGLFGVFLLLCGVSAHRGLPFFVPLALVTTIWLALVGGGAREHHAWLPAFAVAGIASYVMTRRLVAATATRVVTGTVVFPPARRPGAW